jgi:hypothetical protein
MKHRLFTLVLFFFVAQLASAQILISLLFGDKLNNGNIEFGLDGGMSISNLSGFEESEALNNFNLGFYFDFKLKKEPWVLHTGLMLKSTMGATNINVYPIGDESLDLLFDGGTIERKIDYFYAPIMMKYTIQKRFYAEAGTMLGLAHGANDTFSNSTADGNEVTHRKNVRSKFHPLDAGLSGGLGYRIWKGYGMNIAVRYYYGLVDIVIDDKSDDVANRSLFLNVGIPIGVGKAQANAQKKELEGQ